MTRSLVGSLVLFAVLAVGCTVAVTPKTATNVVGTNHTISASVGTTLANDTTDTTTPWTISFVVTSGPNSGKHSASDCAPSCNGVGPETVTWTYKGTGGPGVDTIQVCVSHTEVNGEPNPVCDTATKTWVKPTPVPPTATPQHVFGPGGAAAVVAVAGAGEKNRERVATESAISQQPQAPQIAAPQTGTGRITAPNTGEAGLASPGRPSVLLPALAALLGFAAITGAGLAVRGRKAG